MLYVYTLDFNMMTEQKPLMSGFGPRTTADEALTGASTGFCCIQQIPSWREGQGPGYRAAQGLREGRTTGRPTDVRFKGTSR
jgi:hypothetical protein